VNKTGGGNFIIGEAGGNSLWNQTGGALNINNELWIGQAGGTTGEFDLSAGTVTNNSWLAVGREGATGILNISGGSMTKAGGGNISITHGSGASGTINQTGGSFTCASGETWVGEDSGTGTWNLINGTATFGLVHLAEHGSATGIVNLDGGVFTASEVSTGDTNGSSTLNFNGGTLAASMDSTNFLHDLTAANVQSGGAVIDSGANTISVAQPLLDAGGGGGLTKMGSGTLLLNGVNTYTGTTEVSEGTLGGTGTIAGPVAVASGAALSPGASVGTLTINNTLTLDAGSTTYVDVSLDGGATNSDLVTGLTGVTYGGALVVRNAGSIPLASGNVFKLFNAAAPGSGNFTSVTILPAGIGTFNPATGELTITVAPPTIKPPTISGGNLILSGTGGVPGGTYSWLTSTNVAAPLATWTTNLSDVFDGTGAFSNAIPVNASEPQRYFRLQTP
jgi:autotransporter-associated beta strand protein